MFPEPITRLLEEFKKLPGIGPKSAERLTFYLLKEPPEKRAELASSILALAQGMRLCGQCSNWSEHELCRICSNPGRNQKQLCVVEEPTDVFVLESTGVYKGVYHVLHGALSPLDGIGPEHLKIPQLFSRLEKGDIEEIIIATNPTITGEATAVYLSRALRPRSLRVTFLAQGLPMGGHLEFADQYTLKRALLGRREEHDTLGPS